MKVNWPAVVLELRNIMIESVSFVDEDQAHADDLKGYFRITMFQTDNFHPWNSDGELDRALSHMPARCDYRSLKSYWATKNARYRVEDTLDEVLYEMEENIRDHFSDAWNFPPGYRAPDEIEFASIPNSAVARIIRAAKT